jgi:hypothetical protein
MDSKTDSKTETRTDSKDEPKRKPGRNRGGNQDGTEAETETEARCAFGPSPLAVPVSVGRPRQDAADTVKGAEGERSDPLTVSAMLPPRPTEGVPCSPV